MVWWALVSCHLEALSSNDNWNCSQHWTRGGGNIKKNVSVNLIKAIKYAKLKKGKAVCIVGRKDGYAYKNSDISVLIDVANKKLVTPVSETFQALIWHLLVSHPKLQVNKTKW